MICEMEHMVLFFYYNSMYTHSFTENFNNSSAPFNIVHQKASATYYTCTLYMYTYEKFIT